MANALKILLMSEIELYSHVSDEEFELIRLNKFERRSEILKNIKVRMFGIVRIDSIEVISRDCATFLTYFLHMILWNTRKHKLDRLNFTEKYFYIKFLFFKTIYL